MKRHKDYEKNVFINCPFDDKYFALRRSIIFAIVYFGYTPRIALESSDSGQTRLDKICILIKESKYSIHDLSRLRSKSKNEYYRLNMPFELGIDYGIRKYNTHFSDKRSLILTKNRFDHMKALSDMNGFDVKSHMNDAEQLILCIRSWFSETVGLLQLASAAKIFVDFTTFNTTLYRNKMSIYAHDYNSSDAEKLADSDIAMMTIPEFIDEIKDWVAENLK
jgi:hypothetical protein